MINLLGKWGHKLHHIDLLTQGQTLKTAEKKHFVAGPGVVKHFVPLLSIPTREKVL